MNLSFEDALRGVETRSRSTSRPPATSATARARRPARSRASAPSATAAASLRDQGLFALQQPCPRCRGNGTVIDEPCENCTGTGRERRTRAPGQDPGRRQGRHADQAQGQGRARLRRRPARRPLRPDPGRASSTYERRGSDLVVNVPLTYPEAVLGSTVEVPTPEGPVSLKVPPARRTASCSASAAAARRSSRARAAATCSRASR